MTMMQRFQIEMTLYDCIGKYHKVREPMKYTDLFNQPLERLI